MEVERRLHVGHGNAKTSIPASRATSGEAFDHHRERSSPSRRWRSPHVVTTRRAVVANSTKYGAVYRFPRAMQPMYGVRILH